MTRLLVLAVLLTLPGNHAAAEPPKPVKVFLLAGQSNMEGKAKVALLDYQAEQPATREAAVAEAPELCAVTACSQNQERAPEPDADVR